MSFSLLEPSETDVINILIQKSKPFGTTTSTATLGPWIGLQAAQPLQLATSVKQKREEKQNLTATQRKRSGLQSGVFTYKFEHFPDWEEYINCYKEAHTAKSQKNPFEMRYTGLPQTFISLPHPEGIRLHVRYVEDRSKYPIPVAMERANYYPFKTNSTPNLCLIPADGAIQLPPLEVQRIPSIKLEKRFIYPKNVAYIDLTRCNKANYFADSTLVSLNNSVNILRVDPRSDSKFKARMSNQNEAKNVTLRPFDTRPQTSRKLEKLLVTCENDALNLENMIQSLCKSIPSAKLEQESAASDKAANKRNKVVSPLTRQVAYTPSAEQINDSLLNQFSYAGNKVDYDSPLDLQFDGRIYHTNLETFLQCLDQKLHNSSKASIEDLMNSIHIHTVTPGLHNQNSNTAVSANSVSAAGKRDTKLKSIKTGDELCADGKKIQENVNIKKRKVY